MDTDKLSATFAALADPTRREIVHRLSQGRATVGELVQPFDISWPAVTKRLHVLERAGLVTRHRLGQRRVLELKPEPMDKASEWIRDHRRFWDGSLDALADYLERDINDKKPKSKKKRK